jgi:hypothetical protein
MGGGTRKHGTGVKCAENYYRNTLREDTTRKTSQFIGRYYVYYDISQKIRCRGADWIDLSEDRDQWCPLVQTDRFLTS